MISTEGRGVSGSLSWEAAGSSQRSLSHPDGWENQFSPKLGTQSESLDTARFPDTDAAGTPSVYPRHNKRNETRAFTHDFQPYLLG